MAKFSKDVAGSLQTMDAESNGLLEKKSKYSAKDGLVIAPPADRIWMVCHKDENTGKCHDFIDDECLRLFGRAIARHNRQYGREETLIFPLSDLPEFYDLVGTITGHNLMKFDAPLIEKLLGYHIPRGKRWDTLIQSQTQFCDRDYVFGSTTGPHSVESWALRLNKGTKVVHEDWMNFSVDMYHRCWRDVEVQVNIKTALNDEREVDRLECNINWAESLHTEHMAAFWISYSEKWGFPCNIPYATDLVQTLDDNLDRIEDELLPTMPFRMGYDRCGTKINWETYSKVMLKQSGLTQIPLGWCWAEDTPNRPQPIWQPFKADGTVKESVLEFWLGKDAQPAIPAEAAIEAQPAVLNEKGKVVVKAIRARKARPFVDAKERKPSAYEDDAGRAYPNMCNTTPADVVGPFTRIQWVEYNLGSNNQVLEYLLKYTAWEPKEYTDKGSPKLTDDSFDSIGEEGVGALLKMYLIDKSRRTNVKNFNDPTKGWLNNLREDGRITPINHTMGTPTARSRHANLVNVPSGAARWGKEMRECWTAYENGRMIGSDASGLEMRCLAHEMGDEDCTREIVEGDIHTVIWELIPDFADSRGTTKGVEYCLIYGGADPKLGSLANVEGCREDFASVELLGKRGWVQISNGVWRHKNWSPKKDSVTFKIAQDTVCGSIIRMRIMKGLKPLGDCIDRITKQAEKGYLVGLDGRKLTVRSTHSALNLKLQSTGAILMKTALVRLMEKLEAEGLVTVDSKEYKPNTFVELFTFYHDEYQLGVPETLYEQQKSFTVDIEGLDLSDKAVKKAVKERLASVVKRFQDRQRRGGGLIWSEPHFDIGTGSASIIYCKVGQYCVEGFEEMGRYFKLDCPITGNYMSGMNWYDTH